MRHSTCALLDAFAFRLRKLLIPLFVLMHREAVAMATSARQLTPSGVWQPYQRRTASIKLALSMHAANALRSNA